MDHFQHSPSIALLIDAENISSSLADELMETFASEGPLHIRRAYGDFSSPSMKGWIDAAKRHAISMRQVIRSGSGKNSADIALTVEAMDILYAHGISAVCIASSDSDFSHLARRLRERGLKIFGFGAAPATSPFRLACTKYITIGQQPKPAAQPKTTPPAQKDAITTKCVELLLRTHREMASSDGWVDLSGFGKGLRSAQAGFTPQKHGSATLKKLLIRSARFELDANSKRCRLAGSA